MQSKFSETFAPSLYIIFEPKKNLLYTFFYEIILPYLIFKGKLGTLRNQGPGLIPVSQPKLQEDYEDAPWKNRSQH